MNTYIPLPTAAWGPDISTIPDELKLFARLEGLEGEEARLLRVPEHEREAHERERLRLIGEELDRVFARLRERAERLEQRGFATHRRSKPKVG